MSEHSTSIAAALTVMVLGASSLIWFITTADQDEPTPSPAISSPLVEPGAADVVVHTPPPQIDGLTESVTRVLSASGFVTDEGADELPQSVVNVLVEHGIALTIEVGD